MIKHAVILAAGTGMRLGARGKECPKGFLDIHGKPLISYSVNALLANGIDELTVIVGHQRQFYDDYLKTVPARISVIENEEYDSSGSMYSLYLALLRMQNATLVLDADILYDKRAVKHILDQDEPDCLLLSQVTNSGDEVYAQVDQGGYLTALSKNRDSLNDSVPGEMVGITKLSKIYCENYLKMCKTTFHDSQSLDYNYEDDGFVKMIDLNMPLFCPVLQDLAWTEIDTIDMYNHAVNKVYTQIKDNKGFANDSAE